MSATSVTHMVHVTRAHVCTDREHYTLYKAGANVEAKENTFTLQTQFVICVTSKKESLGIIALWSHLIMIKCTKN